MNPNATNHPISYFRKFHLDGLLDLSPAFQRKPVWSDEQASYLVDSILNDLPVPEIYVRSITSVDGETGLEVVDGQQRLRSIIRFFSGDLELTGSDVTQNWSGASWETLTPEEKENFWSYKLVVRELERATDAEVRDMFRRLNANQSNLNDQELRHSQYNGEFIECVEELADDRWWLEQKIVTPAQIRRMLDVEYISELLVGLISGPLDKKNGLDDYFRDYDAEFPDRDFWEQRFVETRALAFSLTDRDLKGWTSKTEFYSLFLAAGRCVEDETVPTKARLRRARRRLADFREQVNQGKRKDSANVDDVIVRQYIQAVTRASTDRSRRVERIDAVHAKILG